MLSSVQGFLGVSATLKQLHARSARDKTPREGRVGNGNVSHRGSCFDVTPSSHQTVAAQRCEFG